MPILQTGACFTQELKLAANKDVIAATFKKCDGTAHAVGDNIPTCAEMDSAIAAAVVPTLVTAGANINVTGAGTTASPYVVAAIPGPATSVPASGITAGALPAGVTLPATSLTGVVPAANLPSYVDDVVEFPTVAGFPATGETGKIYLDASTGGIYRWSGSTYIAIVTGGTPTGTAGGDLAGTYPNPTLTPAGVAAAIAALTPAQLASITIPVYANDGVTVLFRAFAA
jgi:hypothetical protein